MDNAIGEAPIVHSNISCSSLHVTDIDVLTEVLSLASRITTLESGNQSESGGGG